MAFGCGQEVLRDPPGVVAVRGGAGSDFTDKITGSNGFGSGAAKPSPFLLVFRVSVFPLAKGTRHGPIAQLLQQLPSAPIGHAAIFSALSKTVPTWSLFAFSIN